MKGQLNVNTPAEYIAAVDDKRRSDIAALDALIRKHAPKLEPVIMGGMLGYGPFHYRYASGREGEACKLSIASNASYISLYCFAADAKGYVAERYVDRLPKASIGKACVRFKKLADLDEKALWHSSRTPRRWASSPEPARRRGGGRPRAGNRVAATRVRVRIVRRVRRHRHARLLINRRPPSRAVHRAIARAPTAACHVRWRRTAALSGALN